MLRMPAKMDHIAEQLLMARHTPCTTLLSYKNGAHRHPAGVASPRSLETTKKLLCGRPRAFIRDATGTMTRLSVADLSL